MSNYPKIPQPPRTTTEEHMAGLMEKVVANLRNGTMKLHTHSNFNIINDLDGKLQRVTINLYVDPSS